MRILMKHRIVLVVLALMAGAVMPSAQIGTVVPIAVPQFLDNSGLPLNGGLLYTCSAASTCPGAGQIATYSDSALSVPNANPIVLNSAGRPTSGAIYLSATTYKFVLQTSAAVSVWTLDNVAALAPWNLNTVTGKIIYTAPTTLTVATNTITPTQNVHTVDTTGGAANVNTIAITNTAAGFPLLLTGNNPAANPVTLKNNVGNLTLSSDFTMGASTSWISLIQKSTTWYEVSRSTPQTVTSDISSCDGRLTLSTGVPVTTADVTAATTIYWTPYKGNTCYLYDGIATWNNRIFTETTLTVPNTSSQMYDVFVYDSGGTPTLETLAWTNDTARATALTTQNGVAVKTGASTRRYLGSFRTTAVAGQTEDSAVKRYVWNYYNRVSRPLVRVETTANWTYTTATVRQANGSTANQVEVVVGVAEVPVDLALSMQASNGAGSTLVSVGIGEDSTTTYASGVSAMIFDGTIMQSMTCRLSKYPAVGRHVYSWNEWSTASNTTTWVAFRTAGSTNASGLQGMIQG